MVVVQKVVEWKDALTVAVLALVAGSHFNEHFVCCVSKTKTLARAVMGVNNDVSRVV